MGSTAMGTSRTKRKISAMRSVLPAMAFVMVCLLASCATYSKVSERRPRFRPVAGTIGALAKVQSEILEAQRFDRSQPLAALGGYLTAAQMAALQLRSNPDDQRAMSDYNFAVARIITTIRDGKLD